MFSVEQIEFGQSSSSDENEELDSGEGNAESYVEESGEADDTFENSSQTH